MKRAAASWWRGRWGFSWGLKERDVGGSNGGGCGGVERAVASWWRGRQRGGDGSGLEARGFQKFNVREIALCFLFLILFI